MPFTSKVISREVETLNKTEITVEFEELLAKYELLFIIQDIVAYHIIGKNNDNKKWRLVRNEKQYDQMFGVYSVGMQLFVNGRWRNYSEEEVIDLRGNEFRVRLKLTINTKAAIGMKFINFN